MKSSFSRDVSYDRTWQDVETCAMIGFDGAKVIHLWNRGAVLLYGYSADELEGELISILSPDEHYTSHYMDTLAIRRSMVEECWQRRRDGSLFWAKIITAAAYDRDGAIIGYTQIVQDISIVGVGLTVGANQFFGESVSHMLDYGVLLLDRDGIIQYASKSAEILKRYRLEEMIGMHVRTFYVVEDQEAGLPEKLMAAAGTEGKVHYEGWRVRKDGSRFWGAVLLTALTDWEGKVIGYYKIIRDLTERKQAREVQERHISFLERHSKEVEELAYISSHDLKEPIRTIISFLDLFREHYEPVSDETGNNYINVIRQCAERMLDLVNAILQYSLIGYKPDIGQTNLNSVLEDVEKDLHDAIQSTGAVIERGELPTIIGYRTELRQLFQNLISNAIKFRKKGSAPVVTISAAYEYPDWTFVIADNGIGFNAKFAERIFQLFQRLHRSQDFEGTGIGLSYAKKIVGLHKGRIWAESMPGEGSRFYFTIPEYKDHEDQNQRT